MSVASFGKGPAKSVEDLLLEAGCSLTARLLSAGHKPLITYQQVCWSRSAKASAGWSYQLDNRCGASKS